MSDLQDIIARTSVKAFNSGTDFGKRQEQERIIGLLTNLRAQAQKRKLSQSVNINAVIAIIKGEANGK